MRPSPDKNCVRLLRLKKQVDSIKAKQVRQLTISQKERLRMKNSDGGIVLDFVKTSHVTQKCVGRPNTKPKLSTQISTLSISPKNRVVELVYASDVKFPVE